MARQNKNKTMKVSPSIKNLQQVLMNRAVNLLVILLFAAVLFLLCRAYLYRSDYFRLRAVETQDAFLDHKSILFINNQILSSYKGKNVFTLNLKYIAGNLWRSYPDAKSIVVKIALPDKLIVNMRFRRPVALVKSGKLYPVDEEGVALPSVDPASVSNLPVIDGASTKSLRLVLELLRDIKESRFAMDYAVMSVNAQDPRNLLFYLKNGPEIRVGCEDFKERIETLRRTLKDPRLVLDRVEYVDLRFGDPVIGPK